MADMIKESDKFSSNHEKRLLHYKHLGLKIAYYRKEKDLTQLQLAEKVNLSRTYISNIEAPKSQVNPTLDVIFDIADALGIAVSKLFEIDSL